MDDGFIKIIDDKNELLHEALNNGNALTTPTEGQMLINMSGVSINAKPRKDGRYQGYVINTDGKKQYFYGRTFEEVTLKIKLHFQEEKAPKRKKSKKNTPTFEEYVNQWIELYKKPNLKPLSLVNMLSTLKPAMNKFATRKLDEITTNDIQMLLLSIEANRTRELCKTYLNEMLKKAVKKGDLKINPCDALEIKKYKSKKKKGLTVSEQQVFDKIAESSKYALLFKLLSATGIRIGEALALTRSDIDFTNHTLTINKNVVFVNGVRIEQDTPKSEAGNRTLPIPANICTELEKIESDTLFPYTYNAINHAFQQISKKAGFTVSAHILRHTYSDRLEEAGIPPKIKQYLMGHASLDMTQNTYTDTQDEYVHAHADKIRNIFDT